MVAACPATFTGAALLARRVGDLPPHRRAHLGRSCVERTSRGRGVGTALRSRSLEHAHRTGATHRAGRR
ncbi:GNAT family N-acetyltransferase [Nonomuraea sp. NPDC048892]|uniref:GNAT family N-acetyltransferase n=1 Tax=Nonomuraea sp. NPDC048892 TaxID=3154624 RepID=UPI0033DCF814